MTSEPSARLAIAYHEAGHAVVATFFGFPWDYVTIEGTDEYSGKVHFLWPSEYEDGYEEAVEKQFGREPTSLAEDRSAIRLYEQRRAVVATAGVIAGELLMGSIDWDHYCGFDGTLVETGTDQHQVNTYLLSLTEDERDAEEGRLFEQARGILKAHWHDVERLAHYLVEHGRLDAPFTLTCASA